MFRTLASALVLFLWLASCGSKSPDELADPDVAARAANPEGAPYPTDHLGSRPRLGSRPGDRIPNLAFTGYPEGDRSKGLVPISLADFYDPDAKHHRLLHIQAAATWCAICSSEADATREAKDSLGAEGVVYLEVLVAGASAGYGPAASEVDDWVTKHQSNYSVGVDVRSRRLAALGIDGFVMPYDLLIDTRTMEILDSSGGAAPDLVRYDRAALQLTNGPKSY